HRDRVFHIPPTLAPNLAALSVTCNSSPTSPPSHSYDLNSTRGLESAPEEVREPPEHAGGRRKAPRFRAIAHREVGDQRRGDVDGEAGVGPLLEPRRHRREQQPHAEELRPRKLHP